MKLEFDPQDFDRIVSETLDWRNKQTVQPSVWETYAQLMKGLEETYPGRMQWPTKWYYDRSAGFLQAISILYVSLNEYVAITGSAVATAGGSGPFPGEIFDWVIDGEINSFEHGEFEREATKVGQLDYLPSGQMKGAAIDDHYWAFEYGRGPIPLMWPTTVMGTFQDMDFKNLFEMMATATKDLERNLLKTGGAPVVANPEWHNWVGNRSAQPSSYRRPATLADLVGIVNDATNENLARRQAGHPPINIRAVGAGYSWAELVPTDQWIVETTRLDRVLDVDRENHTITVEAGMTVGALTDQTSRYRMVVNSPTVITLVTVGGMVAVGAHGGGMHAGSFPDWVLEFTFVRADGQVITLRKDDPADADDIRAAQVALGSMGLLYSVKLQCAPAYNTHTIDSHVPLEQAIAEIPDRVQHSDFVEYLWFPTTDKIWVKDSHHTNEQPNVGYISRTLWRWWDTIREPVFGFPALRFFAGVIPRWTHLMMKIGLAITFPRDAIQNANDALHYERYYPKCYDMSVAIPLEHAQDAWRFLVAEINAQADLHKFPVNLMVHARYLNGSDSYLSPTRNRDTCYIEMLNVANTKDFSDFFERIEVELRARYDGFPHWAKMYYDADTFKAAYGSDMDRFLEVRERWDPDRLFLNDFLEQTVFQLPPNDPRPAPVAPPPR